MFYILLQTLEENIITFVRTELKKFQEVLSTEYPECLESQKKDENVVDAGEEEQRKNSRQALLKITLHFLRSIKQEELADSLQSSKFLTVTISVVLWQSPLAYRIEKIWLPLQSQS